jgi:hypothetical protein
MSSFEALYGNKCNTPMIWDNPTYRAIIGPDLLQEMEEKMTNIKKNLKVAQDRQKIYVDENRVFRDLEVGKHVFLKVKVKRSFIRSGCFSKLVAKYCGTLEILENIGLVAYMLTLLASMRVHNIFHVSLLNKYVPEYSNHIIDWTMI